MSQRIPVYFPSQLNLYDSCPYAYWKKYVDRSMPTVPTTPAQARGTSIHAILNAALKRFAGGGDLPEDVRDEAGEQMQSYPHLESEQVEHDIDYIEQCVEFALDHFDISTTPVMIERNTEFLWKTRSGYPFALLKARVDAILRHADGTFEIIDWKSGGSTYPDAIQNLLLFVTAREYLRDKFAARDDQIRLTIAYLGVRDYVPIETTRESMYPVWRAVGEMIRQIQAGKHWRATENNLCGHCPLHANGCPLEGPNYLDMEPDPEYLQVTNRNTNSTSD
jgi:RecB family exonuclease